jgi:hypothetical protein
MTASPLAGKKPTVIEEAEFTIEQEEFEEPILDKRQLKKENRRLDRRRRRAERKLKRKLRVDRKYRSERVHTSSDSSYYTQDDNGNVFTAKMPERLFRDRMFLDLIGDHFTTTFEIFDFLIGLSIVGLVWALPAKFFSRLPWKFTGYLMLIVMATYTILIIPQKLMANRFNCKSRYVLSKIGMVLSLITSISPIKILSPGVLVVPNINYIDKKQQGLISFIGPAINLVLGLAFLFLGAFLQNNDIARLMLNGSFVVSNLVILGLLPFGLSRGRKIYSWSKAVYFTMLIIAIGLFAASIGLEVIPFS